MKLLLKISYCGSNYCGWQYQPDKPTVQNEICTASEKLFGYKCDVTGCSRTDSGVHAKEFICTVTEGGKSGINTSIALEKIPLAFCSYLPSDISVHGAAFVSEDFHPRYDVAKKEYIYRIYTRRAPSPFETNRSYHYSRPLLPNYLELMNKASQFFVGRHDFTAFMAQGSKIIDAHRTVFSAQLETDPNDSNLLVFRVSADGFLYNMVRIMTGTLLSVGSGKIAPEDIPKIIETKNRANAGETVPPEGLYLNKVFYPVNYF